MSSPSPSLFGKYRDLLIAIALFLVLDLGVLIFNYASSQFIENDTARINTAGELRMYSQQLAKAVLTLKQEFTAGDPTQTSLAQLSEARDQFGNALSKLAVATNRAPGIFENQESIKEENDLVSSLNKHWEPIHRDTAPILASASFGMGDLDIATTTVVNRNLQLMQFAGDLTALLEKSAVERAASMRRLQIIAIALAFLNFIFIVFKFLRSLSISDHKAEAARRETRRILGTVQEGLFLLGANGKIGSQRSTSLDRMLGRPITAGETLISVFENRLDHEQLRSALEYIELLFNKKMRASLVKQLNPLQEVAFLLPSGKTSFLDFEFEQVRGKENDVEYLLITVFDVSRKVMLERELAGAEQRARSEVDALLAVLEQDPAVVTGFLLNLQSQLDGVNASLQSVEPRSAAYANLIARIGRVVHGIKGEGGALGLLTIEDAAHAFENIIAPLRGRSDLSGDDLIPVAVAMNDLLEAAARLQSVIDRVQRFAAGRQPEPDKTTALFAQMEHLTLRVASDLGKQAKLQVFSPSDLTLPERMIDVLRTTLPQLVRNAIAHGIEPSDERLLRGKASVGTVLIVVNVEPDGGINVTLRDDGRGLSPEELRKRIVDTGMRSPQQAATMSDQEIVAMLFEPGFTQLDEPGLHAGRGDGLTVVRDAVTRFGGNLKISSRPNSHTQFTLQFGKGSALCA